MSLESYFESNSGRGILSTVSKDGEVNAALYATPHFFEDGTLGFIMTENRTYQNLKDCPRAHYLFMEGNEKYSGKRLSLTKVREENEKKVIEPLRRRTYSKGEEERMKPLHLVIFELDAERPLVGA